MEIGFYPKEKLSNEAYHAGPGISKSGWTLVSRSLAHFKYHKKKETAAMRLGSAVDAAMFEPKLFFAQYSIAPEGMPFNKKDGIAFKKEAEEKGKIALTFNDGGHIPAMIEAVRSNEDAAPLLAHGMAQVSAYYKDPVYGFLSKVRTDWVTDSQIICDLKTTTDVRMEPFAKIAFAGDKRYDFQNVVYCEGMTETSDQALGNRIEHEHFRLIAVEVKPPHEVKAYWFEKEDLLEAMEELAILKEQYAKALETGIWPGYNQTGGEPLQKPRWMKPRKLYET